MKSLLKNYSILLMIGLMLFCGITFANTEAENQFDSGLFHYEQDQYELAIPKLESAVQLDPENAEYHHVLAKSYGREAEKVNWFKAIGLAKKTLAHLKIAVDLDKKNLQYLDDLMDFYREAPGFLGGNPKKADEIEVLIEKLGPKQNEPNCDGCLKIE